MVAEAHFITMITPRKCFRVNHRNYIGVLKVRVRKTAGLGELMYAAPQCR
jgi:hypothetical protein